ncbi:hypothetical protein K0M31_017934 [Melipona bicolor]|uniref:Uncharacterized protein n=1 Tax=Melipona bicolor TaxID=60889 RepID=A0AA40G761_9HYME|nr:hypothetical protein K0M31_017934 [Melipona bicolor]
MDTSTLVILRETLMHRHPRKWFSVCLSDATPKRSTSRPQARTQQRQQQQQQQQQPLSKSHSALAALSMAPAETVDKSRACIMQETSHDVARRRERRSTRNEERTGEGGRSNRGETSNGRILPGFAYHSINSEQRAGPVLCLSFFVGICR